VNGAWGFASTSVLTKEAIARAVDAARKAARAAAKVSSHKVKTPGPVRFTNGEVRTAARLPLSGKSLDEKIALVADTEKLVRTGGASIKSSSARYTELVDEKWIVTSDGARVHLFDTKPELRVSAVAAMEGELQNHVEAAGHTGGFGDLFSRKTPEEMA
jgi:predicted Zn-dependent protease